MLSNNSLATYYLFIEMLKRSLTKQEKEIREAIATSSITRSRPIPAVLVIPIRMMEAWLLFEEQCIRQAAGCPRGKVPLGLPKLTMI